MRRAMYRLRNRHLGRVAIAAALVGGLAVSDLSAASADPHPTHTGIVTDQPVNYTPNVLNGHVSAFVQIGDTIYAAGAFGKVEKDGQVFKRRNIVAFSATTGEVSTTFKPAINGQVYDVTATPDQQGIVAVGSFTKVNDQPGTSRIAMISVADGSVDPSFVSPRPNDKIRDIAVVGDLYYVAGDFTKFGTDARRSVATLDATGDDTGSTHLNFQGNNDGGQTKVQSMDVTPDGTHMVVAGNFATIDGVKRAQLAVLNLSPGLTTLNTWSTRRMHPVCGPRFDTYVRDVAIDPAGMFFVLVNTGGPSGFQRSGLLCDTATRWELNGLPKQEPTWINYAGGDTLTAAIVDTNVVYVGGHMRWMNNSYGHNNAGPGAVPREGIAALDPANGLPYTWNPGRRRGYGVFGFMLGQTGLWTGSDTKGFGGELRNRIAFCKIGTGTQVPPNETGTLPGDLVRLGRGPQGRGALSQPFTGLAVGDQVKVPNTRDWRNARGAFVVDQVLYSGWANGRLRAQPFDGFALGPAENVNLRGAFPELANVRAMFFDRVSHRLYYTLIGSTTLRYRYFTPESRTIGSFRYLVDLPSEVNWAQVRGGFIVDDQLYFSDVVTGNLRRVGWDTATGMTTDTPVDVLGPLIDGGSFASPGLVFLN